jgi:hypothetical protein
VVLDTVLEQTPGSKLFANAATDHSGLVPPQGVLTAVTGNAPILPSS